MQRQTFLSSYLTILLDYGKTKYKAEKYAPGTECVCKLLKTKKVKNSTPIHVPNDPRNKVLSNRNITSFAFISPKLKSQVARV